MTDRERLLEILNVPIHPRLDVDPLEAVADYLLDNGVTFAKDTNVPSWIPVSERLPDVEELVLIICKNGKRSVGCYRRFNYNNEIMWGFKTALNPSIWLNKGKVTYWMPLPEPPKDVGYE